MDWKDHMHKIDGSVDVNDNLKTMIPTSRGTSGSNGTGVDLTDDITPGRPIAVIYVESAGNLGLATFDDNPHVIPVVDKTWITFKDTGIVWKTIYKSTHASYATTATGVHYWTL